MNLTVSNYSSIIEEVIYQGGLFMSIFYNNLGEFQWVSVTALISILGIFVTLGSTVYTNKKTIRANVQSKTSIEWINKIRELSAELINNYESLGHASQKLYTCILSISALSDSYNNEKKQIQEVGFGGNMSVINRMNSLHKEKKESSLEYNKFSSITLSLYNQLSLYFVDDLTNNEILEKLEKLKEFNRRLADVFKEDIEVNQTEFSYQKAVDNYLKIVDELSYEIENFRKLIAKYIKDEWNAIQKK
ncbi:hypothetical protein DVY91_11355 [Enterococcus faecalis]|nr:hypothetical protein CG806_04780 [Enterococcus faecalis ARO1/DG]TKM49531.1 hypothetical protein DVW59_12295 [Enterococcus faecalis]EEU87352.1 predicted protein [Enterococcus faecalis ARO1/DG]TKM57396.1 hypothetical protein DVW57_13560 [Enterococcus faecalis]TKM65810.1 hypothetical protein DVW55_10680 [Enterococcus faecalis]